MGTVYSVQAPNGDIIDIEGPDDATDEQVAAFAEQQFGGAPADSPELVDTVEVPASAAPQSTLPQGIDIRNILGPLQEMGADTMAAVRGFGDTMTLNFAPKIGSAIESGEMGGPEYERVLQENRDLRAADNPSARGAGELLGMLGGALVPAGALGQVAGLGRQMLVGSGIGAATGVASGAGAAATGEEFDNAGRDAIIGASAGLVAPGLASGGRKVAQVLGIRPQTAADDAIRGADLNREELMKRAAAYQAATGKGARLVDILTPDEAARFTGSVSRSGEARTRVLTDAMGRGNALPAELSAAVAGPAVGPTRAVANRRSIDAANYGAAEKTAFPITGPNRIILENDILPFVSLPKATSMEIGKRFEANQLLGGDLVTIRRALDRFNKERTNAGTAYADLVTELDAIIDEVSPALTFARNQSSAARAFTEGAEIGRGAARAGDRSGEVIAEIDTAKPLQAPGIAPGTRAGLIDQAANNPRASYALARELETNPNYQAQLRAALPGDEADALIAFATAQKQSIDNLAALARIPQEKAGSVLDSLETMTDVVVAAGLGAGGAFKATLANEFAKRVGVGAGPARKLADDLLNPARRERVFEILEKAGLPRDGVRELAQGAFISTANTLNTAGRLPNQ